MATQSSGAGVGSETLCETEKADKDETATLKIKLKKKEKETKKIQWTEDTVDNEGLGKKKSKVCCVYKKPRPYLDCSSSEDEEEHCHGH